MASINPYLNFNGTAEKAFNFYKSVFGGEFTMLQRFKDVPKEVPTAEADSNKIMHVALPIGETILMGSDIPGSIPPATMGDNFAISVNVDSEAEAKKVFNGLSAGGKIIMPLGKTFWNAYYGMCTDKFGISWMVNYQLKG